MSTTALVAIRERSRSNPRGVRRYESFRSCVSLRSDLLAQKIHADGKFPYEPESRAAYAAHLGLPYEDRDLKTLWEYYIDGELDEGELIQLVGGQRLFVAIYPLWCDVQICPDGSRLGMFGPEPFIARWPAEEVHVRLPEPTIELLLENRRLARIMMLDLETWDATLDGTTHHTYELWAPAPLRSLMEKAAIELCTSGSTGPLARLNRRMRTQLEGATAIYQWYDAADRPIYYGITGDLAYRQATHARSSEWSRFAARCEIARAATRRVALTEERRLIRRDQPIFNRQHNDTPEARARYMLYLAERGRLDLAR